MEERLEVRNGLVGVFKLGLRDLAMIRFVGQVSLGSLSEHLSSFLRKGSLH